MFFESVLIQIRFRYEYSGESAQFGWNAQEFITLSKITLDHAAIKLGINYESVKDMPNAPRIGHEVTEIRDASPRFTRFSLTIVIKNGPSMLRGHHIQNDCSS